MTAEGEMTRVALISSEGQMTPIGQNDARSANVTRSVNDIEILEKQTFTKVQAIKSTIILRGSYALPRLSTQAIETKQCLSAYDP